MDLKKQFKFASIALLFLGVLDAIQILTGFFEDFSFSPVALIVAIVTFAIVAAIALAKIYMGAMGLKYCKGAGKGTLHIKLAKIGIILTIISGVISLLDMIFGSGSFSALLDDITGFILIEWYYSLAKQNLN